MRVPTSTNSNALIQQLSVLNYRTAQLQSQAASGRRVQSIADDPAAAQRILTLQSQSASVRQYRSNIAGEKERATAIFSGVTSLKKISDRAGEIATLTDGLKTPEEMTIYANEVGELIKQAVQVANTRYNGSYLFGGTRNGEAPFTSAEDSQGRVTSVSYGGNQDLQQVEISEGVTLTSQVVGVNSTGSGPRGLLVDSRSGSDLFNHLIFLRNHLLAGDASAVQTEDRENLAKDEDNLLYHISNNGAVQSRLEASGALLADRSSSIDKKSSDEGDADLAKTLVQLNATQTAYQAALQSSAKLLDLSLMNFIR